MAAPAPVDTSNALLTEGPAQLATALVDTPAGQRLTVTVRTASATVTVFLAGKDAREWAANLTRAADRMSVSGLIVAPASGTTSSGARA